MEDSISGNHYLVSENYVVHSMGNKTTVVDCDILRPGYLTLGSQVIQFADFNSNVKSKDLHPLEIEIQKDAELKLHRERLINNSTVSVIQSPIQIQQNELDLHGNLGTSFQFLGEGVLYWASRSQKERIDSDEVLKSTQQEFIPGSISEKQEIAEKNHLILESEHLNFGSDENEGHVKCIPETNSAAWKSFVNVKHTNESNMSVDPKKEINSKNTIIEFDFGKKEDDVEPASDYESEPGSCFKNNEEQLEKSNKCYMCFKNFRQKKNMYAHIRKIHSTQPKIPGGISCPLCKMHALRQEHLRIHLETLHGIPIEKEEKLFNTIEEFFMWKERIEKETFSFYVSKSSSKLLAGNQQKTYYKCHRSGNNETCKKRNNKNKYESKKIGATCPAAIEMTENSHGINVIFWKTHVGHDTVDQLLFIRNKKTKIMDYVASGFSWNKIVEIIKAVEGSDLSSKVLKDDSKNLFCKKINAATRFHMKKQNRRDSDSAKSAVVLPTSQSFILEKVETLLKIVRTTDIRSDFRPKVCSMIDNLISMIKRRSVKSCRKENGNRGKKKSQT